MSSHSPTPPPLFLKPHPFNLQVTQTPQIRQNGVFKDRNHKHKRSESPNEAKDAYGIHKGS